MVTSRTEAREIEDEPGASYIIDESLASGSQCV